MRLLCGRRGSGGAGKVAQHVLIEEMGERPVADVMEKPGQPQGLDDQAFGWGRRGRLRRRQSRAQARVEMASPQPGFVHHPQAVGEAAVLGRGEDPARALELADAPHPLQPGRVEQVALGRLLRRQPEAAGPLAASAAWSARCSRGSGR